VEVVEKTVSNSEMERFHSALRGVVSVSKSDLQKFLAEEKANKINKPKPGPKAKQSNPQASQ
jgi:hypothetical protein